MLTTTIGAFPKPDAVPLPDWFRTGGQNDPAGHSAALAALSPADEALIDQAIKEVVCDQAAAGIDIPTDGEVRRENYIHYHCRHLEGFDFAALRDKGGARRRPGAGGAERTRAGQGPRPLPGA